MKGCKSNKGFTLMEVVVALAVLAIVVTPTISSFITSMSVNRNARRMMTQTDVAQSIMEGFTDKTYEEIKSSLLGSVGISILDGANAFSSINEGIYNTVSAGTPSVNTAGLNSLFLVAKKDTINFNSVSTGSLYNINTEDLYSAATCNVEGKVFLDEFATEFGKAFAGVANSDPLGKHIGYFVSAGKGDVAAVGYSNIENNGYKYDAIITFVPCATDEDDIWYPYVVNISLYEVDRMSDSPTHEFTNPVMRISSGIKNSNNN